MNAFRTPRRDLDSDRRGLTHVSTVIARLLAMYGIDDCVAMAEKRPTEQMSRDQLLGHSVPTTEPNKLSQQSFQWFATVESQV